MKNPFRVAAAFDRLLDLAQKGETVPKLFAKKRLSQRQVLNLEISMWSSRFYLVCAMACLGNSIQYAFELSWLMIKYTNIITLPCLRHALLYFI